MPVYEIYAVKYAGPLVSSMAMVLWLNGWDLKIARNYYIFSSLKSEISKPTTFPTLDFE